MATEYWGDSSTGYDSKIPIKTILIYIKSKYGAIASSVGYGDFSANIHFTFGKNKTIKNPYFSFFKMFFSFKKQQEPLFISTNPSYENLLNDIETLFKIKNIKNITFCLKGGLEFKYLNDKELDELKRQQKMQDKLGNF